MRVGKENDGEKQSEPTGVCDRHWAEQVVSFVLTIENMAVPQFTILDQAPVRTAAEFG
jgi:hypothetical protein